MYMLLLIVVISVHVPRAISLLVVNVVFNCFTKTVMDVLRDVDGPSALGLFVA